MYGLLAGVIFGIGKMLLCLMHTGSTLDTRIGEGLIAEAQASRDILGGSGLLVWASLSRNPGSLHCPQTCLSLRTSIVGTIGWNVVRLCLMARWCTSTAKWLELARVRTFLE